MALKPERDFDFPFCPEVLKYEKVGKVGQGTFGEVFKAKHRDSGKFVALKKVLMENEKEGFPITALREIRILKAILLKVVTDSREMVTLNPLAVDKIYCLQYGVNLSHLTGSYEGQQRNGGLNPLALKHENIVKLHEICRSKTLPSSKEKTHIYLVFEFCDHDLAGLLSNVLVKFSLADIKKVMQQMFEGLFHIHLHKILHRDMKAANILITRSGILKLCDFGLARVFQKSKGDPNKYTNRVVTLWYRPPELLLGEKDYGPPIDLWGAGCIMAEMWTRSPIMQGSSEQHQLTLISQLCGSMTPDVWPCVENLPLYSQMELPKGQKRKVKERLKAYIKDPYALDLLDKLLTLDPSKRLESSDALDHDFFWVDPLPHDLGKMLSLHNSSMFEYTVPARRRGGAGHPRGQPARPQLTAGDQNIERVF